MAGYLWRKYCCGAPIGEPGFPVLRKLEVGNLYPELMRWGALGESMIGLVYADEEGPPTAVCYDLQGALKLFSEELGKTQSRVIDAMETVEAFTMLIMGAYADGSTPYFYSDSEDWFNEVSIFALQT